MGVLAPGSGHTRLSSWTPITKGCPRFLFWILILSGLPKFASMLHTLRSDRTFSQYLHIFAYNFDNRNDISDRILFSQKSFMAPHKNERDFLVIMIMLWYFLPNALNRESLQSINILMEERPVIIHMQNLWKIY
jgi:hypothetical protein